MNTSLLNRQAARPVAFKTSVQRRTSLRAPVTAQASSKRGEISPKVHYWGRLGSSCLHDIRPYEAAVLGQQAEHYCCEHAPLELLLPVTDYKKQLALKIKRVFHNRSC